MPGLSGKLARIKVAATASPTNVVAGLKSAALELDGKLIDDSEFGVDWDQVVQSTKSWKLTLSGSYRPSDTTGQVAIRASLINDTDLYASYLPDNGTTANAGVTGQVRVAKFSVDDTHDGIAQVSIELQGTGTPSLL